MAGAPHGRMQAVVTVTWFSRRTKPVISSRTVVNMVGVVRVTKAVMSESAAPDNPGDPHAFVLEEVELLLSEKRTALSMLRTGSAMFALPLSVSSVLIVTSRFYDVRQVMHLLVPLLLLNVGLTALAVYPILHSIGRIHRYDLLFQELKRRHSALAERID
jgi:hypothetical protein